MVTVQDLTRAAKKGFMHESLGIKESELEVIFENFVREFKNKSSGHWVVPNNFDVGLTYKFFNKGNEERANKITALITAAFAEATDGISLEKDSTGTYTMHRLYRSSDKISPEISKFIETIETKGKRFFAGDAVMAATNAVFAATVSKNGFNFNKDLTKEQQQELKDLEIEKVDFKKLVKDLPLLKTIPKTALERIRKGMEEASTETGADVMIADFTSAIERINRKILNADNPRLTADTIFNFSQDNEEAGKGFDAIKKYFGGFEADLLRVYQHVVQEKFGIKKGIEWKEIPSLKEREAKKEAAAVADKFEQMLFPSDETIALKEELQSVASKVEAIRESNEQKHKESLEFLEAIYHATLQASKSIYDSEKEMGKEIDEKFPTVKDPFFGELPNEKAREEKKEINGDLYRITRFMNQSFGEAKTVEELQKSIIELSRKVIESDFTMSVPDQTKKNTLKEAPLDRDLRAEAVDIYINTILPAFEEKFREFYPDTKFLSWQELTSAVRGQDKTEMSADEQQDATIDKAALFTVASDIANIVTKKVGGDKLRELIGARDADALSLPFFQLGLDSVGKVEELTKRYNEKHSDFDALKEEIKKYEEGKDCELLDEIKQMVDFQNSADAIKLFFDEFLPAAKEHISGLGKEEERTKATDPENFKDKGGVEPSRG